MIMEVGLRASVFSRRTVWLGLLCMIAGLAAQSASELLRQQPPQESPPEASPSATEDAPEAEAGATPEAQPLIEVTTEPEAEVQAPSGPVSVYVIPIQGAISKPNQFIYRRGAKAAITENIDVLVLDIDTPGGRGDVMFDLMEGLQEFRGTTIAYVNNEALSAGAFISFAADEIWYAPTGIIGAAEVVQGTGEDIPQAMKRKLQSYINAKIRAIANEHPHKADVMRAMTDESFVLERDGKVLKEAGELLSLTADEALTPYGEPPVALFGAGIADSVEALLEQRYGAGNTARTDFTISWSEELAKFMDSIAPILLGIGVLALFLEFQTPGFGVFGISGITLLGIVFLSNYVAGLAGQEAILLFLLGLVLVAVELFLFPGVALFMITGLLLVLGSLIWSMADLWPTSDGGIVWKPEVFLKPFLELSLGFIVAAVGMVLVGRFLPQRWVQRRIGLQTVAASPSATLASGGPSHAQLPDVGSQGVVVAPLRPVGVVEVNGTRFDAVADWGTLDNGQSIQVVGTRNFALRVAPLER